MTRRPRFVDRAFYWRQPREYRRDHALCCVAEAVYCPVCGNPWSGDGMERCDCYARDPDGWRKASWERQKELIPELGDP
jgi:predicted amidophosphoribosyltransferase